MQQLIVLLIQNKSNLITTGKDHALNCAGRACQMFLGYPENFQETFTFGYEKIIEIGIPLDLP